MNGYEFVEDSKFKLMVEVPVTLKWVSVSIFLYINVTWIEMAQQFRNSPESTSQFGSVIGTTAEFVSHSREGGNPAIFGFRLADPDSAFAG